VHVRDHHDEQDLCHGKGINTCGHIMGVHDPFLNYHLDDVNHGVSNNDSPASHIAMCNCVGCYNGLLSWDSWLLSTNCSYLPFQTSVVFMLSRQ
jgi:hypothetical protein